MAHVQVQEAQKSLSLYKSAWIAEFYLERFSMRVKQFDSDSMFM